MEFVRETMTDMSALQLELNTEMDKNNLMQKKCMELSMRVSQSKRSLGCPHYVTVATSTIFPFLRCCSWSRKIECWGIPSWQRRVVKRLMETPLQRRPLCLIRRKQSGCPPKKCCQNYLLVHPCSRPLQLRRFITNQENLEYTPSVLDFHLLI